MAPTIGIDLGTTHSLVAVFEAGKPKLIPNSLGNVLTPSVVGMLDNGQILVGEAARDLRITRPERCAATFKRLMGGRVTTQLGTQTFSSAELSSLVMKSLKHDAEAYLKETVTDAVITVPAYFNDSQRKATRLAGELAGLNVRRILNEPTAAALAYGFAHREAEKKIMVIDLGGGTFDVTLLDVFDGTLEVVATAGESMLGGEDFTDRLVAAALQHIGQQFEATEMKAPLRLARLRTECEKAKRSLSQQPQTVVRIPETSGEFLANAVQFPVDRELFRQLCLPLLDRLRGPINKVLRDSGLSKESVDEVILVGGATRMSVLVDLIHEFFGRAPTCEFNPDEVVALGAAVQAALLEDDAAVDDVVMTDVCPFTLGVEVVKGFGNQKIAGYFSPIIHRNTTIPVAREETFSTLEPFQTQVTLQIYQGESRKVKDNHKLGELSVDGFPPQKEPQEFLVRFTYDLNGILEVEAIVPATKKRCTTIIAQHASHLSPKEIQQAVKNMQKIKFFPRDQLPNQKLLHYAESMVGEVAYDGRELLDSAIDAYEAGMSSANRDQFESARNHLLDVLRTLGVEYTDHDDSQPAD